jgi:hypothetical protein
VIDRCPSNDTENRIYDILVASPKIHHLAFAWYLPVHLDATADLIRRIGAIYMYQMETMSEAQANRVFKEVRIYRLECFELCFVGKCQHDFLLNPLFGKFKNFLHLFTSAYLAQIRCPYQKTAIPFYHVICFNPSAMLFVVLRRFKY